MQPTTIAPACIPREIQLQAAMFRLEKGEDQIAAGYEVIKKYHKTVTVFGSARTQEDNEYYQKARELGAMLAREGYAVVTGGGGGIMEAANRGAKEAGGTSIGFNIILPHEQSLNDYTTDSFAFSHFAPRKIVMTMMADAYVYFPGGFGTVDELSEILTLTQTKKISKAPIFLYDNRFWSKWHTFVTETMRDQEHVISDGDENLYTVTENLEQIVEGIKQNKTYCNH